jgi:hypothetical protein
VTDLPSDAHEAVNRWFDEGDLLVELRLCRAGDDTRVWAEALNRRNRAMLVGGRVVDGKPVRGELAGLLFACWDGGRSGTGNTVEAARALGVPVVGPGLTGRPSGQRRAA